MGLLVNILAADEKCPLLKRDSLMIPIQTHLHQNRKKFSVFFTVFLKCSWNFDHFDKKDDAHRFCNFEITDSEIVVRSMSKKTRLRKPFGKQHGKRAKALLKVASQHFPPIHWPLPSQLSWKKSPIFTCQILGLLDNTLPADENNPALNRYNLKLSCKKYLLLRCQILGLLLNTLAADENNPVLNKDNLMIPIQMKWSQKKKIFSEFFARFLKSSINF